MAGGFIAAASYPVSSLPLFDGAADGRDGSPSRPFVQRDADIDRLNGGFGEPALPKTVMQIATGDRMIGWRHYSRSIISGFRPPVV